MTDELDRPDTPTDTISDTISAAASDSSPGGIARRRFLRGAAATAVALPAVAAATAGRAAAGVATNPLLAFRSVEPYRCYDSRWTSKSGGGPTLTFGRLNVGATREVAVWPKFTSSGSTAVYDSSPMPGSTEILAVAYNVTIVGTIGTGYLMIGPGGSVPTSSHINWFGTGHVLANAGNVRIQPGEFGDVQTIEVRCGGSAGSSTHFIVDVTGWFEVPSTGPVLV